MQLQLQLRYTTLHPTVVVRWPLQPLQPHQKTQLQPPVGPSVDLLCHPWFTATSLSYRFPVFETSATASCGTTGTATTGTATTTTATTTAATTTSTTTTTTTTRRKFRSQTSDNLPTIWTDDKQRWEESEKRREEKRRRKQIKKRKSPKKEDPHAEKVRKSRNTVFFQWFVAPEGRKVGSLKRRVRSHVVRWEMTSCTLLWREARFQVKMCTTLQLRRTFRSWDVEQVRAVVVRSTFPSQNVQSTSCSDHFWKLRCRKSARRCGAKHISKSKCTKHHMFAPVLDVQVSFRVAGARDGAPCQKWAKREGFVASLKTMAGVGHLKRICMFIRDVRRSGRWFPERGCIFEHQIFSFGKMILRDRCSTSYDLASLFRCKRSTLDRWSGKIAKHTGTRPSALHSTFHFWRKSRRIVSFLMLSTSKIEEVSRNSKIEDVSQNCFGFWRCQIQKLRNSPKIAKFSSLQIDRQIDR